MSNFKLEDYTFEDGTLHEHAWPGGYPLYYLTEENDTLCASCATQEKECLVAAEANYEDRLLFCDECSERIPSAYSEDLPEYQVVVGNIGTVYSGLNLDEAIRTFHEYVRQSRSGYGRAAGESVVIMKDGEPMTEVEGMSDEQAG